MRVKTLLIIICLFSILTGRANGNTNTPAGSLIKTVFYCSSEGQGVVSAYASNTVDSNFGGKFVTIATDKIVDIFSNIYLTNTLKNYGNHEELFRLRIINVKTATNGLTGGYKYHFETLDGTVITNIGPVSSFGVTNFRIVFFISNAYRNQYLDILVGAQVQSGSNTNAVAYVGFNGIKYGGDIGLYFHPGIVSPATNTNINFNDNGYIRLLVHRQRPYLQYISAYQLKDNSGNVIIKYTGYDDDNDLCLYVPENCEYSFDRNNWFDMAYNSSHISNSSEPLSFTTNGNIFTYVWKVDTDLNIETNIVYVRIGVKDISNNVSLKYYTNIVGGIDTIKPYGGEIRLSDITSGDTNYTDNTNINVSITNEIGAFYYLISETQSNQPLWNDSRWISSKPTNFVLTGGDGEHTVYVWLKDNFNNISSTALKGSIILDTEPPAIVNLSSPVSNSAVTNSLVRFVFLTGFDSGSGINHYVIEVSSNDSIFSTVARSNYNLITTNWTVSPGISEGIWYWRVRAVDNMSNYGNWSEYRKLIVDNTAPNKVLLNLPVSNNNINNNTPVFSWSGNDNLSGIDFYVLELSSNNFNSEYVITNNSTTWIPAFTLSNGMWYWKVKGVDRAGNIGIESSTWNFMVDIEKPSQPILVSPLNDSWQNHNPVFKWNRSSDNFSGVTNYTVILITNIGMTNTRSVVNKTNFVRTNQLSDGIWWWKVISKDRANNYSDVSVEWKVGIDTVNPNINALLPPDNNYSGELTVKFSWNGSDDRSGIYDYIIMIDTNNNISDGFEFTHNITSNEYYYTFARCSTNHWKVKIEDNAGNSNVSSIQTIIIDTNLPVSELYYPVNVYITNLKPIFKWSRTDNGSTNKIIISSNFSFVDSILEDSTTNTNYIPAISLREGTNFWKIYTLKEGTTNWYASSIGKFWIDRSGPEIIHLKTPADNSIYNISQPLFSWQTGIDKLSGLSFYNVEISSNSNFNNIKFNISTSNTNFIIPFSLSDGIWYWRVRGVDSISNLGKWSLTNLFRIDTTPPEIVSLTYPVSNFITNNYAINLKWNKSSDSGGSGIAYYVVELSSNDNNFINIKRSTNINLTNWTVSPVLGDGIWYWRVRSVDYAENVSSNSSVRKITLDTVPPDISLTFPGSNRIAPDITVDFQWNGTDSVSGIKFYKVKIDTNNNIADGFEIVTNLNVNYFNFKFGKNSTNHWTVFVEDFAGNTNISSIYPVIINTNVPVVKLYQPLGVYTTNSKPLFVWSKEVTGDTNKIQIGNSSLFTDVEVSFVTTATEYIPAANLNEGKNYWRVLTHKIGTVSWFTSESAYFWIDKTGPDKAVPLMPENNLWTTNKKINFTWKSSFDSGSGISNYQLQIGLLNDFSVIYSNVVLCSTNYTVINMSTNVYYWRIRAIDKLNNLGEWSKTNSFVINTSTPYAVIKVIDTDGITNNRLNELYSNNTNVKWLSINGFSHYYRVFVLTNDITGWDSGWSTDTQMTVKLLKEGTNILVTYLSNKTGLLNKVTNINILDTKIPGSAEYIIIEDNKQITYDKTVNIAVGVTNVTEVIAYYIGENTETPEVNSAGWQFTGIKKNFNVEYVLSEGYGNKTVKIWLMDRAGNISKFKSDGIVYENEKPDIPENSFIVYPNPFNINKQDNIVIKYNAKVTANVFFDIYTITGNYVGTVKGKDYTALWNGRNKNNRVVASGLYLILMRIDNKVVSKKPGKLGVLK